MHIKWAQTSVGDRFDVPLCGGYYQTTWPCPAVSEVSAGIFSSCDCDSLKLNSLQLSTFSTPLIQLNLLHLFFPQGPLSRVCTIVFLLLTEPSGFGVVSAFSGKAWCCAGWVTILGTPVRFLASWSKIVFVVPRSLTSICDVGIKVIIGTCMSHGEGWNINHMYKECSFWSQLVWGKVDTWSLI